MKKCSKCGVEKELAEFSKGKSKKDGLRNQCKICSKAYDESYREANKDKRKAYRKAYREDNKDKRKAYNKAYRESNKDRIKAYKEAYNEANKDKRKAYNEAKKSERIEQLKKIIEPNTDDQWVYVMQCGIYNKIGISNDPLRRVEEIERETQAPTKIIYLAKPFHGRTRDCEKIIHHELKCFNVPIPYAGSDTTSVEWFFGDLDKMVEVVSTYAEIEEV